MPDSNRKSGFVLADPRTVPVWLGGIVDGLIAGVQASNLSVQSWCEADFAPK
ncbi:hypothetical protein [Citrobacter sp. JGM124]|uniref:hypothetical protein n=1 Tax=Citrobacter sp. JGM124 TaxID=2799789 RepID=UPI001BA6E822|nr:hypothetical protein [Citrobacter sp. JGM124]MBS0847537.1 hypothetical protein [Citrobacter sp. JGM124]